jgi:hypothetical protein
MDFLQCTQVICRLLELFSGSLVALRTFRVRGGLSKAETSFLRSVTGRIFRITVVSDSKEAAETLLLIFCIQKDSQKW